MAKPKDREPELARALNAVRRLVRGLRSAAEAVERELSVSAAQLFVLRELDQVPDQSVKDLAAVTMTTTGCRSADHEGPRYSYARRL